MGWTLCRRRDGRVGGRGRRRGAEGAMWSVRRAGRGDGRVGGGGQRSSIIAVVRVHELFPAQAAAVAVALTVRGNRRGDGHVDGGRRRHSISAVRRHDIVAAEVATVAVAVMVAAVVVLGSLLWVLVIDVATPVVGVGPVVPHGLFPPRNGPAKVLQRLETFLHALQQRQVDARVSQ